MPQEFFQELFPTTIIRAMLPYVDTETAHSLELLLRTERIHELIEQTRETMEGFQEAFSGKQQEFELSASETDLGRQFDLEGMIQAVHEVCGLEEKRKLEYMLMAIRVQKIMTTSQDPAKRMEAIMTLLGPEAKNRMDEIMPFMAMMQGNGTFYSKADNQEK